MALSPQQRAIVDHVSPLLDLIQSISQLEKQLIDQPTNLEFMSDTAFVIRKSVDVLDAFKKKLKELESKVAFQAATVLTAANMDKYQGELCTISDNSSPYVKFPQSPSEEGFKEFMEKLSPEDVRPHYPTVAAKIASELEKGNQLPFGLEKKGIISFEWKLRVTSKKDLNEV